MLPATFWTLVVLNPKHSKELVFFLRKVYKLNFYASPRLSIKFLGFLPGFLQYLQVILGKVCIFGKACNLLGLPWGLVKLGKIYIMLKMTGQIS